MTCGSSWTVPDCTLTVASSESVWDACISCIPGVPGVLGMRRVSPSHSGPSLRDHVRLRVRLSEIVREPTFLPKEKKGMDRPSVSACEQVVNGV